MRMGHWFEVRGSEFGAQNPILLEPRTPNLEPTKEGRMPGFDGKVAVVTGGSSGIGRASALAFARQGARVVIADVNRAGSEETVRMIAGRGGEARFVQTDVSRAADAAAM